MTARFSSINRFPKFESAIALVAVSLATVFLSLAQDTPPPSPEASASAFEELPELKASEILRPEFLKGPHHTVRESVLTFSGANQFVIDSDFGVFQADGNAMLVLRVKEIYAIAQLEDVSRGDEFKNSLVAAAKSPLNAARNIVNDPVKAVSNVPKGIMKFMGRAGDTIKGIGKKESGDNPEGNNMQQIIGFSDTKRKIALGMGIDPYSTNAVLQKELDSVAWASWAGGFAFTAATLPISGPVGAALTVTNVSSGLDKLLKERSPEELKRINRSSLRAMGVTSKDIERLLSNTAFSPSQVTEFVLHLKALDGVANRGAFVRSAAERTSSEADAIFCLQTAALMSQVHQKEKPLARITMLVDFPVCIAKDGTIIVAMQWDYAVWTAGTASFAAAVEKLAAESGEKKPVMVIVSGQMSPLLQQELQKRNFLVKDRATPGPLN